MAARYVTLALDPAIEETIELDALAPGAVNTARGAARHAAGEGMNIAACLADWGADVTAAGLLGAENDAVFRELFARKRIADRCARFPGATRVTVRLRDSAAEATTGIERPGDPPPAASVEQALAALHEAAGLGAIAVLCGRLPPGVAADVPAQQVAKLRSHRATVVLGAGGASLQAALAALALPQAIGITRAELQAWSGEALPDTAAALRAARAVTARGVGLCAVSLGAEGALFVTAQQAMRAAAPLPTASGSVGDAMLAGVATGLAEGLPLEALGRRAGAFAAAAVRLDAPGLPDRAAIEALAAGIPVAPIG